MRKVDETVKEALAEVLLEDVSDPRLDLVTITSVQVSPDLRHANVYVVTHGIRMTAMPAWKARRELLVASICAGVLAVAGCGESPPGRTFFDRTIKPILAQKCVGNTSGCHATNEGDIFEFAAGNLALYEKARALAAEVGVKLTETGTGGGSDGNFTAALGCPTLDGLGCLGSGSHSITENVIIAGLPERTALVAALLRAI
jgi:hypothetical protein